jgi:hypothetical protein
LGGGKLDDTSTSLQKATQSKKNLALATFKTCMGISAGMIFIQASAIAPKRPLYRDLLSLLGVPKRAAVGASASLICGFNMTPTRLNHTARRVSQGGGMITQDEQDNSDFGLPPSVIKQAASELIIRHLMPQIEEFMSMAIDALAHDTEIANEEAAAILWAKVGSMAKGLKLNQWTANHAAIYFRAWGLFAERENATPYQVDNEAYNVGDDDNEDEGGETVAA